MRILFAISMLSFFTLLVAVLALLKKVLLSRRLLNSDFSQLWASDPYRLIANPVQPNLDARLQPQQMVKQLGPQKIPDWRFMIRPGDESHPSSKSTRKGPQPTHFATPERSDWTYFNKDLGDLSDPYKPQRNTDTSRR